MAFQMSADNFKDYIKNTMGQRAEKMPSFPESGERLDTFACFAGKMVEAEGAWSYWRSHGKRLSSITLSNFFIQIFLTVLFNRLFLFLLKPLRQTHIIPFILGGMALGPSFLGRNDTVRLLVFPTSSFVLMELTGLFGLFYYFFALGVRMDLSVMKMSTAKKGILLAFADIAFTILIAFITFNIAVSGENKSISSSHPDQSHHRDDFTKASAVLGVAASMLGFPVLNRILVQLRLSNTEMGRIATSCSIVETTFAMLLLPVVDVLTPKWKFGMNLFLATKDRGDDFYMIDNIASLWVLLSNIGFIILCFFVFRPAIRFIIHRTPDGESFNEVFVSTILVGVILCGFVTDVFCSHAIVGPFLLGIVISNGSFGTAIIAKVEDIAYGIMLPLYFVVIGLRTRLESIFDHNISMKQPFLIIFIYASFAKLVMGFIVSKLNKMPYQEGIILGLLLNTKGFIQLIVFSFGLDQKGLLDDKSFAWAICLTLGITGMIPPTIQAIYNPTRLFVACRRRSIQISKGEPELRILSCIHNPRSVPAIINLLGLCQPTKKSPFSVYALHLLEQTKGYNDGPLTMVIGHRTASNNLDRSHHHHHSESSEHIIKAFKNYEQTSSGGVTVHSLATICPYSTMHEEICNVAETKGIALIILPFHQQQTIHGGMEETNPSFRDINDNILNNAPCSVAILVDRGLSGGGAGGGHCNDQMINSSSTNISPHRIFVLFFGGPDDREALSLAWMMTHKPNISLTVLRFVPTDDALKLDAMLDDMGYLKLIIEKERERQRDDDYVNMFRQKTSNKESVMYIEKVVNDVEETVRLIRSIDDNNDDDITKLFIVGRGHGVVNALTAGLIDFSECPEIGAIGDLLTSADFGMNTTSVLIVQQYMGATNDAGSSGAGTPDYCQYNKLYENFHNFNQMSPQDCGGNLFRTRVK